jgi:hypothetical protein
MELGDKLEANLPHLPIYPSYKQAHGSDVRTNMQGEEKDTYRACLGNGGLKWMEED